MTTNQPLTEAQRAQRAAVGLNPGKAPPRKIRVPLKLLLIGVPVLWVASCGAGLAMADGSTAPPAQTIEVPVPGPTVTETTAASPKTKTVKVVPKSCIYALESADRGFGLAGTAFGYVADILGDAQQAFIAVANVDPEGMQVATDKLNRDTKKFTKMKSKISPVLDDYKASRDTCRDAAS